MIYKNYEPDYRDVEDFRVPHQDKTYYRATKQASDIFEKRMRDMGLHKIRIPLAGGHTGVIWRK